MRFFSARLNFDNGIVLKFDGFLVNLFQYKTATVRPDASTQSLRKSPDSRKTEAGPDATTRRVVAPKSGLVCPKSGGTGLQAHAERKSQAEPS